MHVAYICPETGIQDALRDAQIIDRPNFRLIISHPAEMKHGGCVTRLDYVVVYIVLISCEQVTQKSPL